ncbi:MAG: sulfatase-like hydrolase/transferase [Lutibacter sp.]|uniref:sulfatase family protein n=1 Tax=Lutibacter sp. TaxID=1925666 RepID=UPI0019F2A6F4|nr:sulfatase [Lutibacter sp.]NOR27953.1 sulfatase-like hydrolase/transferase [Lutibacter sp.]
MCYKNLFSIILITILTFSSCNKVKNVNEQPNIVWITSEDNSKHYMKLFDENGVKTPHIEKLAENGIVFTRAFSNAPVCSAARSTLISGCYGPRIASHYHRKSKLVPMPKELEMFPAYLRKAGYYTTNKHKEDYNIIKSDSVWDESSKQASWRNRAENQPFFHVFNIMTTHESRLHFSKKRMKSKSTITNKDSVFIQPNHPITETFKYTNAYYRDKIVEMDNEVGEVISQLKEDGLLKNTFVFYFGDHGGVLPGSKGYLTETGLHVPLVVSIPEKYKHLVNEKSGSTTNGFVSFIDFGATVLNIAGIKIPKEIDGKPFLGKNVDFKEFTSRDETYSYSDRLDEKYDMVRSLRKGKYKYVRNYQPFNFDGLMNNYRYRQLAYKEWSTLNNDHKLNKVQTSFFEVKQPEFLYNVEDDPFETTNLATNPKFLETLTQMREKLTTWVKDMPDLSFFPEHYLIQHAFNNPVEFGQQHKNEIQNYIDIANLMLLDFELAKSTIKKSLNSNDPWERYWALIVCSSFGESAIELTPIIKQISILDTELVNKVRAAEFLGIVKAKNPSEIMLKALYETNDEIEALLILNSIVLMKDGFSKYSFSIELEKIAVNVSGNKVVKQRLSYLKVL